MKNMLKKGYVSIELVIVAGIVLVFGLFAINRFIKTGQTASEESNTAIKTALSTAKATTSTGVNGQ